MVDKVELLRRAAEHIFSYGLDDSGARIGLANMAYGLAKIHLAQEAFGVPANATFIAAPDATITRNTNRWRSGFGYGGLLTWGDGQEEWVVLDLKPNCCGMLVGGLNTLPDKTTLLKRVHSLQAEKYLIDDIPIQWDFGKSNHFITVYRTDPLIADGLDPFAFILHGSGPELRSASAWGDGLYWDTSEALRKKAELFPTPFGPLRLLTGQAANEYYAYFLKAKAFSQNRRVLIAEQLFDEIRIYSNENHQGLVNMNAMALGAYLIEDDETVLPLTLQAQLPSYLLRGQGSISDDVLEQMGFGKRARKLSVLDRLRSTTLLPHGGGYTYPHIHDVVSVIELGEGERYFELSFQGVDGRQIVSDMRDLPFAYRGEEVVERVGELALGEFVARLDPVYVLKL